MIVRLATALGTVELDPLSTSGAPTAPSGNVAMAWLRPQVTVEIEGVQLVSVAPYGPPDPDLAALPWWTVPAAALALVLALGIVVGINARS